MSSEETARALAPVLADGYDVWARERDGVFASADYRKQCWETLQRVWG